MRIISEAFGFKLPIPYNTVLVRIMINIPIFKQWGRCEDGLSLTFSDDSAQNAATTCEHMRKSIHCMYEVNLFTKDGIVYDNTYRCSKQWRCANTLRLLLVLSFTRILIIHGYSNAPGYGRSKIYGINKSDKSYLRKNIHDR